MITRNTSSRAADVDLSTVDIHLRAVVFRRDVEMLNAHQIFAWWCGLWDSEVQLNHPSASLQIEDVPLYLRHSV
jgi:hypothetical protein